MADETVSAPPPTFSPGKESPLYSFAEGLGISTAPERSARASRLEAARNDLKASGEKIAKQQELMASDIEKGSEDIKRIAAERQKFAAAPPPNPALSAPPPAAMRPFLQPGQDVFSQIQNLILAAGTVGLQMQGLKGGGYAIAATAAMKGMVEGWQQGDADRVKRSYLEWDRNQEKLLAEHHLARQQYEDILKSYDRSIDDRLSEVYLRAQAGGHRSLAEAARRQSLAEVFDSLQRDQELDFEIQKQQFGLAKWIEQQKLEQARLAETKRENLARDARAATAEKQRDRALGIREEAAKRAGTMSAPVVKWQGQLLNNEQALEDLGTMETMIGRLAEAKLLQRTPAAWESIRASSARQLADKPELKEAMDWMQRLGTAALARAEIAAGEPPGTMRLKSVTEPQLAHILNAGPDFWQGFFARTRRGIERNNDMIRKNLQAVNPAALSRVGSGDDLSGFELVQE